MEVPYSVTILSMNFSTCTSNINSCNSMNSDVGAEIYLNENKEKTNICEDALQSFDCSLKASDTCDSSSHIRQCLIDLSIADEKNVNATDYSSKKRRGIFACSVPGCGKQFSRPDRLEQHLRSHTGDRPYVCKIEGCGRTYARSQHLKRHNLVAHDSNSKPTVNEPQNVCLDCNKQFSSVYSLRKHSSQYHSHRKHGCDQCDQLFLKQQHLLKHMQTHTNQPSFKCSHPGCTKAFALPSKLRRHQLVHATGRYTCTRDTDCHEVFNRHVDLRRHLAQAHPFVCGVCGVEFQQLNRLNKHRASHEDLRLTYHCTRPGCGRCYYTQQALVMHVLQKHEEEEQQQQKFKCGVCYQVLATKQKLQQHLRTHSPGYLRRRRGKGKAPRLDKGIGRTDYRRLLAVLPSGSASRLGKETESEEANRVRSNSVDDHGITGGLTNGVGRILLMNSNKKDEHVNVNTFCNINTNNNQKDSYVGTRKLLEGSTTFRRFNNNLLKDKKGVDTSGRNTSSITIVQSGCTSVESLSSSNMESLGTLKQIDINRATESIYCTHVNILDNFSKQVSVTSVVQDTSESKHVGDVYISGKGAIKKGQVLLTFLNRDVEKMLSEI